VDRHLKFFGFNSRFSANYESVQVLSTLKYLRTLISFKKSTVRCFVRFKVFHLVRCLGQWCRSISHFYTFSLLDILKILSELILCRLKSNLNTVQRFLLHCIKGSFGPATILFHVQPVCPRLFQINFVVVLNVILWLR
jgi:hypothetical protein